MSAEQDDTVNNRGEGVRDRLDAWIQDAIDSAPPLTSEQAELIRQLLPQVRRAGSTDDAR